MRLLFQRVVMITLLIAGISTIEAQDRYSLIKLGVEDFSEAYAINDNGQVAMRTAAYGQNQTSVVYYNQNRYPIPDLPGSIANFPLAMNQWGHIAGLSAYPGEQGDHAFLYDQTLSRDLGTLSGGYRTLARGINDDDSVVGYSDFTNGTRHAFLSVGGIMFDLGSLGGGGTEAVDINNSGQVVGFSLTANGAGHGFLYSSGLMTDLTIATDGVALEPSAINDAGVIVGRSFGNSAFVFKNGITTVLGSFGGPYSAAYGLNDFGHVVGYTTNADYTPRAFFYTPTVGMLDLNEQVTLSDGTAPGFTNLEYAAAINNRSWIIGRGAYFDGTMQTTQAFLLVPQIPAAAPEYLPSQGTFYASQNVALSTATPDAVIRYTTDGSSPTSLTGTIYTGPITVSTTMTLKAVVYGAGFAESVVSAATYTILPPLAAAPEFNPNGGTFTEPQSITMSTTTVGAAIRYTTDGSIPSQTLGTIYSDPVTISSDATVKAIAFGNGYSDSSISSAAFTIVPPPQAPAPVFSLPSGVYDAGTAVTITSAGSTIRYTTDGSVPTATTGILYTGPILLTSNTMLRAIAYQTLHRDSDVTSATYTVVTRTTSAPVFNPAGGTFNGPQTISMGSSTAGASIRYTTNGTIPTPTSGILYTGPITLSAANTTLKAIAYKTYWNNSTVSSATYKIKHQPK